MNSPKRYLGGGILFYQPYNLTTKSYEEERQILEVKEFKVSNSKNTTEFTNHDGNFEEMVEELIIKDDATVSFKTQSLDEENLKLAFFGTSTPDAATSGTSVGAAITSLIGDFSAISNAEFSIPVDGATQTISALDLTSVSSFSELATALSAALTGASCRYETDHLIITSDTTGAASSIGFAAPVVDGMGTDISSLLGLDASATLTQGKPDGHTIDVNTVSAQYGRMRFVPKLAVGNIDEVIFHKVAPRSDGDMALQTTEAGYIQFSGKVLKDTTISSGSKTMQIKYRNNS